MVKTIKSYEKDLKKLKEDIRILKIKAASQSRKKKKNASDAKKHSRTQSSKSKKDILKHKAELKRIKEKVSKLEKRKKKAVLRPTINFKNSITKLNKNVESMLDLFTQTHEELEKGTLQPEKQIIEKLDTLLGQNEKIAQGILTVANMISQNPGQQAELLSETPADDATGEADFSTQEAQQPAVENSDNVFDENAPQQDVQPEQQPAFKQEATPDMNDLGSPSQPIEISMQQNNAPNGGAAIPTQPEPSGPVPSMTQPLNNQANFNIDAPAQTHTDNNAPATQQPQDNMPSSFFTKPQDDSIKEVEPANFPTDTGEPLFQTPFQPSPQSQSAPPFQTKQSFGNEPIPPPPFQAPPPPGNIQPQSQPPGQPANPVPNDNVRPIQQNTAPIPPFGVNPVNKDGKLKLKPFDNEQK